MPAARSRLAILATLIGALAPFCFAGAARAAEARVASPDRSIVVTLKDDGGRATYGVAYRGENVVSPSRLGLLFKDGAGFDGALKLAETSTSASDKTWVLPVG